MNNLEVNCTKNTALHIFSLRQQTVFETAHTENKLSIEYFGSKEGTKNTDSRVDRRILAEFAQKTEYNSTDQVTATESVFGE